MNQVFHLLLTLKWTTAAVGLNAAIFWFGLAPLLIGRSLGLDLALRPMLIFGCGYGALILTSWCTLQAEVSLQYAFALLWVASVAGLAAALSLRRDRCKRLLSDCRSCLYSSAPALLALLVCTLAFAAFVTMSLSGTDLDMVLKGNNDIHMYAKVSDFLLQAGEDPGNIAGIDLRDPAEKDVFGAFVYLAFAAHLLHQLPVSVTLAPLIAISGLIGMLIAWIAARVIRLPWPAAIALSLCVLFTGLFAEVTLNYFLSQLIGTAMLLLMLATLLDHALRQKLNLQHAYFCGEVFLACIAFSYPALLFQDLAVFAMLSGWLLWLGPQPGAHGPLRSTPIAAGKAFVVAGAVWMTIALLSPARMSQTLLLLRSFSQLDVGGWPLDLISPLMLAGVSAGWTFRSLTGWPALHLLALAAMTLIAVITLLRQNRSLRDRLIQLTPLMLAVGALLVYLTAWLTFGTSYRQWKIAACYVLVLGFALPASLLQGICTTYFTVYRRPASAAMTLVLLAIALGNFSATRHWQDNVGHFPRDYLSIAAIDAMPDITEVVVDLPEFGMRMMAASLIRKPRLSFLGLSYYGTGIPRPAGISDSTRYLRLKSDARPGDMPLGDLFVLSRE